MKTTAKIITAALCAAGIATLSIATTRAYATYAKWPSSAATFYINPSNLDVDATLAESAIITAMNAWNTQAGTPLRLNYGGRVNDTSTGYDGKNVVLFRNTSNGGALATTYSWNSGTTLLDADVVFWDGAYTFTAGDLGCSGAAYIEDVATHELGHALGLEHSTVGDATMYPSYNWCSMELRTLADDDIQGARSLYGVAGMTNNAPSVTITSPSNNTSFANGASVSFSGSASDTQDGPLSAQLTWSSSIDGVLGSGASFTRVLSAGTHIITASVTDSAGATSSSKESITVAAPATSTVPSIPTGPTLSARGYKVKGQQKTDLSWGGFGSATSVNVYRNNALITTTPNDGAATDSINSKGGGTYKYRVCSLGTCSNDVTVTF